MQDNEIETGTISLLLGSLILACIVGILAYGVSISAPKQSPIAMDPAQAPLKGEAVAQVYFEIGSAQMPEESGGAIQTVVEKAKESPDSTVLISGFHDPSGAPEQNAMLAKARAEAARKDLIEAGLAAERIILRKPEMIPGTEDMQEARRVDLWLQ